MANARAWAALFLLSVALAPLLMPARAMHTDEVMYWIGRTDTFISAITAGDFAATVQTEHPGVTTVALGAVGRRVQQAFAPGAPLLTQLQIMRTPLKLVNAIVVPLAYLLLWRLVGGRVAFLAGLMWATEPYMRWYTRLLHIDGLSTTLMMLAFLLMLWAWGLHVPRLRVRWWGVVLAGVVGGLAALTRFSSFYLVGMAGILALVNLFAFRQGMTTWRFALWIALPVLLFGAVIALTWTAFYPGMWTNAAGVWDEMLHGVDNAVTVHENGSYFMGQPTADPGVWYYPVALPFRVTPWLLLGLPLAAAAALRGAMRDGWRLWLAVALYIGVYMLFLTWQGKKFDRYALPVFPALHLLAAFGWLWAVRAVWDAVGRWQAAPPRRAAWALVMVGMVTHSAGYTPDEYAYFNPLLGGGGAHVEHMLIMGAGEGLQGVADYFAQQPHTCSLHVATIYAHLLDGYLGCGQITWLGDLTPDILTNSDYIVNYISYRQRFPAAQAYFGDPVHTVEIHGITYAEIYRAADLMAR